MNKLFLILFLCGGIVRAEDLQQELKSLQLPENQVLPQLNNEKLYASQSRFVPLALRPELSIGAAKNFNSSSFLISEELNGSLHFYLSDRFFTALYGSYVFSRLSDAGNRLWETNEIFPDICVIKYRADATLGYQPFYGKFRLSMDTVFYFDQYIALGAGFVNSDNGIEQFSGPAAVADIGMSFWFGRHWSARVGVKDYYFRENRRQGTDMVHHILAHFSVGFVFGGSSDA